MFAGFSAFMLSKMGLYHDFFLSTTVFASFCKIFYNESMTHIPSPYHTGKAGAKSQERCILHFETAYAIMPVGKEMGIYPHTHKDPRNASPRVFYFGLVVMMITV